MVADWDGWFGLETAHLLGFCTPVSRVYTKQKSIASRHVTSHHMVRPMSYKSRLDKRDRMIGKFKEWAWHVYLFFLKCSADLCKVYIIFCLLQSPYQYQVLLISKAGKSGPLVINHRTHTSRSCVWVCWLKGKCVGAHLPAPCIWDWTKIGFWVPRVLHTESLQCWKRSTMSCSVSIAQSFIRYLDIWCRNLCQKVTWSYPKWYTCLHPQDQWASHFLKSTS